MPELAEKLNISEEEGYLRVPYSFFKQSLYGAGGRTPTRSEIGLYGLIYGLSAKKNGETGSCKMSYSTFEEKLHVSRSTVARSVKSLKDAGKIVQDKSHKTCASYCFTERPQEKGYVTIELYLYNTKFTVRGEEAPRYLTQAEIHVLGLIKTHCENEKGTGKFTGSARGIAKTLGLNKNTVQSSLSALLGAGLIFRAKEKKGVNNYVRSEYTINKKLLRQLNKKYKKATEQPVKRLTEAEQAADDRTERERFYAQRRNAALERAESFEKKAEQDEPFRTIVQELRKFPPKMGKAAAFGNVMELEELQRKERELKAQRAKRLTLLGLSEDDLHPHWHCPECEDTGYIKDSGRACSCYSKGRRRRT